jgi:pimeloyl-ACP methyl ester carboxylesterase
VAPRLAEHHRVLLLDLAGHGFSEAPEDGAYTLDWHADLVAGWMRAIGVPRAVVVGHSYGGGVAQWMLLKHRDRVERLGLVAPGGLGQEVSTLLRLASAPMVGRWLAPRAIRTFLSPMLRLGAHHIGDMEADERRLFVALTLSPGAELAFRRTVDGVIDVFGQYAQTLDRIGEVRDLPPTALFWGDADWVIPAAHGLRMQARMYGLAVAIYPGVRHFPHLDVPERFVRDLTGFLRRDDVEPIRLRRLDRHGMPLEL